MAVRTRAQLNSDAGTKINDNTAGEVSPQDTREMIVDLADSALLAEDGLASVADLASTTNGEGASTIGVEDSAANFTGTDVEAVLAELAGGGGGGLANIVEDTTPQLGGDLDINGNGIVSTSNGNIAITPNGTGDIIANGAAIRPTTDGTGSVGTATFGYGAGYFDTMYVGGNQVTALADPGADRGLFWDDSASSTAFHTVEGNIAYEGTALRQTEVWGAAASDETSDLTTGTGKVTFRIPYAFTVTGVYAMVNTAPTGAALVVDINEAGTTILSTKITIDVSEFSGGSTGYQGTAATAAVISDSSIAADAAISVDIDTIGSTIAGAGLKVYVVGYRS